MGKYNFDDFKSVQKSLRFSQAEVDFINDNFSRYGDENFSANLSRLIYHSYTYNVKINEEIEQNKKKLLNLKKEIAEHEKILMTLKRIERCVQSTIGDVIDLEHVIQKKEK